MLISMRAAVRNTLVVSALTFAFWSAMALGSEPDQEDFEAALSAWRNARNAALTGENGWLSLVGLAWLAPGENRFGSDASGAVVLPEGAAPAVAGSFFLEGDEVRVVAPESSALALNGTPVQTAKLTSDEAGAPDELRLGRLRMYVIRRAGRFAVRVKDPQSPARRDFRGIDSYPPNRSYRVAAEFVPYETPREVKIPTVLGTTETMTAPGLLRFSLEGRALTLEPLLEEVGATRLFLIFKDATSGKTTYGAGRFLYTELPKNGRVTLDFNRAYNPPCAFTPYATCPLAPRKNWLSVALKAGEKTYAVHAQSNGR